jgi:hypothetical protein
MEVAFSLLDNYNPVFIATETAGMYVACGQQQVHTLVMVGKWRVAGMHECVYVRMHVQIAGNLRVGV